MNRNASSLTPALLLPLVVAPIVAIAVTADLHFLPDFARGFIYGASIALLLSFSVLAGTRLGIATRFGRERRLDDLDPLGGLPHRKDPEE